MMACSDECAAIGKPGLFRVGVFCRVRAQIDAVRLTVVQGKVCGGFCVSGRVPAALFQFLGFLGCHPEKSAIVGLVGGKGSATSKSTLNRSNFDATAPLGAGAGVHEEDPVAAVNREAREGTSEPHGKAYSWKTGRVFGLLSTGFKHPALGLLNPQHKYFKYLQFINIGWVYRIRNTLYRARIISFLDLRKLTRQDLCYHSNISYIPRLFGRELRPESLYG